MRRSDLFALSAALFLSVVLFFFSGCNLLKLRSDLQQIDTMTTCNVSAASEAAPDQPSLLLIEKKSQDGSGELYRYLPLTPNSTVPTMLVPGTWEVWAFNDLNQNFIADQNEPQSPVTELSTGEVGETRSLKVVIPAKQNFSRRSIDLTKIPGTIFLAAKNLGTVADLSEARFNREWAPIGLWNPIKFLSEIGGGLFFLRPYKSGQIPVIFVHGITGSPVEFKKMIGELDTSKYAPMVFYYPSGIPLKLPADYLERGIRELSIRHGFDRYAIVAHSMGGIVSKTALLLAEDRQALVKPYVFVTISTPWGGHSAAEIGVERSPVVAPVWRDMVPGSPILVAAQKPIATPHWMLFSYKGHLSVTGSQNDTVVSIQSELEPHIQEHAFLLRGFF